MFGKVMGPVVPFVFGVTDVTGPVANQVADLNVVGQMLVKPQAELIRVDQSVVKVSFLNFWPCLLY